MGCLQQCQGSQITSLKGHCLWSYKGLGDQSRFLMTGKIAHFQREGEGLSGELGASQPSLSSQQIFLEATSSHIKEEEETGNSLCAFTNSKVCFTSLISFCDGMATLVQKGYCFAAKDLFDLVDKHFSM